MAYETSGHITDLAVSAVQSYPSSTLVVRSDCFIVPSNNFCMYGKKMRDVNIFGFVVDSDYDIRFRCHDDKVIVGDLLVGFGKYTKFHSAQTAILKMIKRDDEKVTCIESLEIDTTLYARASIVLMNSRDVVRFFNSIGVRAINDALMTVFECVYSGIGGIETAFQASEFGSKQTGQTSALALAPGCFVVPSMNGSMYGRKMCDIHIVGASMESDHTIRFRSKDKKVVVSDLLIGLGKYRTYQVAHKAIFKMIEQRDDKITCLESLEIDENLAYERIILMNFRDVVKFFNSIGVRIINDTLMAGFQSMKQGTEGVEITLQSGVADLVNILKIRPISKYNAIRLEYVVRNAIDTAFKGFIHNEVMYGHQRRIDHRLLIGHTILAIETDENAHVAYKYEDERYEDFLETFSYKFVFVRFNPHTNKEEEGKKTDIQHKLRILLRTITTQIDRIKNGRNVSKLEIVKLFY